MCPKCNKPMLDGEIVIMDWAGNAIEHVACPESVHSGETVTELQELVAFNMREARATRRGDDIS